MIGPLLFLIFVNDLPDVLEALTLLSADDVKMVTQWTQSMNIHSSLTGTGRRNGTYRSILLNATISHSARSPPEIILFPR